jgi:hypothetical protein
LLCARVHERRGAACAQDAAVARALRARPELVCVERRKLSRAGTRQRLSSQRSTQKRLRWLDRAF